MTAYARYKKEVTLLISTKYISSSSLTSLFKHLHTLNNYLQEKILFTFLHELYKSKITLVIMVNRNFTNDYNLIPVSGRLV